MTNDEIRMTKDGKVFDLEDRTAKFGEAVIRFCKNLIRDFVDTVLLRQLRRAATSIGANYVEADDAESKSDVRHKIGLCRKEARETCCGLRMMRTARPDAEDEIEAPPKEAKEQHLIFAAIRRRTPEE